jgi:hypothetical protein
MQKKGGIYGKRNSLAVKPNAPIVFLCFNPLNHLETYMQTEIEILETRETPVILWY